MSVLAVKELIRSTLTTNSAAVVANTGFSKVVIFRQVPKFDKFGAGLYVVVGPWERTKARLTAPRGAGQKQLTYRVQLMVEGLGRDPQGRGDDFDTALEQLEAQLEAINVPQAITDPKTTGQSWLLEIAEKIESHTAEPVPGPAQGLTRFIADVFVSATEVIQA